MEKWEELFPQNTRKKGRELLENGRIRELSVNELSLIHISEPTRRS